MEVRAFKKQLRITPRKIRLVIDLVRGKECGTAISILRNLKNHAAHDVEKVIKQAIANGEHNQEMDRSNLYISEIFANDGITLKRIIPRARGSASRILKRTSNLTVVLKEKE